MKVSRIKLHFQWDFIALQDKLQRKETNMSYEKVPELYAALQSAPIERLKDAIDAMLEGRKLEEIIDRRNLDLLAEMSDERREQIQQLYPGLIQKIPFKMALQRRNTKILEINKEIYFQKGWENSVRKILIWDYQKMFDTNVPLHTTEIIIICQLLNVLSWIVQNVGSLPEIEEMNQFCSVWEWKVYERKKAYEEEDTSNGSLDKQILEWIRDLREVSGAKTFMIGTLEAAEHWICKQIKEAHYDTIFMDFAGREKMYNNNLDTFFRICGTENIRVKNPELLKDEWVLGTLMKDCPGDDEQQRNLCRIYRNNLGSMKWLYKWIPKNLIYMERYKRIILEYIEEGEIEWQ